MVCFEATRTSVTAEASSVASVAIVTLIIFLAAKQICSASENRRLRDFSRCLDVGVAPLFVVFVAVLAGRVQSALLGYY